MPRLSTLASLLLFASAPALFAQTAPASHPHLASPPRPAPAPPVESAAVPQPTPTLDALAFLLGTWSAQTAPNTTSNAKASDTYTFHRDLANHVIERTSSADHCIGPQAVDCQHTDQLTIFPSPSNPHGGLDALYLDSEGHVIRYVVTLPDPSTVLFQSQSAPGAPHFRLIYHLEGTGPQPVLAGRFEGTSPGSDTYHPYLEWSGPRQ